MVKKNGLQGEKGGWNSQIPPFFSGQEMAEIQVEKNAVTVNSTISTFGCDPERRGRGSWGALPISFCMNGTPWKINMEPENHLFEKENHLQNLPFLGSMLIFRGVQHSLATIDFPHEERIFRVQTVSINIQTSG